MTGPPTTRGPAGQTPADPPICILKWRDRLLAVAAQIGQCVAPPARRTRPVASLSLVFACGRVRPACGSTVGSAGGHGRAATPAPCEASGVATFRAEQFDVRVSDEVLADLRARILNTRWPGAAPGAA